MTSWRVAVSSHVGKVRDANEDAYATSDTVVVVADGMGGHAAGEVASAIAIETFPAAVAAAGEFSRLADAVAQSNQAILDDATTNPSRRGMGTTLVSLALVPRGDATGVALVNVGDSRCYQVRKGHIRQLSHDHSWAEEMVRRGSLTPDEAILDPRRHQLTRVLGMDEGFTPDVTWVDVEVGDRYVLCSDGLSNEVRNQEIGSVVTGAPTLEAACDELIRRALDAGGRDNVTVALIEIVTADEITPEPAEPDANTIREPRRSSRGLTVSPRLVAFVGALVALVAAGLWFLNWYGHTGYYIGASPTQQVVIYQGHQGGFLWVKPTIIYPIGGKPLYVHQLPAYEQAQVRGTVVEPTETAAMSYYGELELSVSTLPNPSNG